MTSRAFVWTDRQTWGWSAAGLLLLALASPAWALDLDSSIRHQESESAQLLATLGRDKSPNQVTSKKTHREVNVRLIPKASKRHKAVVR